MRFRYVPPYFMLIQEYFLNRDKYPIDLISKVLEQHNSILIQQVDALHTKQERIKYWQHPLEALYMKMILHNSSLIKLFSKSSFIYTGNKIEILDISSINIISRAIIENYLMIYHIYYDSIDDDQKEFRYLIYVLSGLKSRQRFTATTEETKKKSEQEKQVILELQKKLSENSYFKSLSLEKQTNFLNTKEAKQTNWTALLKESDLNPDFFTDTWRLQSNYAHSEFLSAIQIRDFAKDLAGLNQSAYLAGELSNMIACISIKNLSKAFAAADEVTNSLDEEHFNFIRFFISVGAKGGT